jgi:hypothetical protein
MWIVPSLYGRKFLVYMTWPSVIGGKGNKWTTILDPGHSLGEGPHGFVRWPNLSEQFFIAIGHWL